MTSLEYTQPKAGTKGTVPHASFGEAMLGGFLGVGVIFGAWGQVYGYGGNYVDYSNCYGGSSLLKCFTLSPVPGVNVFEHLVFYVTCLMLVVLLGSLILGHCIKQRGTADPSIVDRVRLPSVHPTLFFFFFLSCVLFFFFPRTPPKLTLHSLSYCHSCGPSSQRCTVLFSTTAPPLKPNKPWIRGPCTACC